MKSKFLLYLVFMISITIKGQRPEINLFYRAGLNYNFTDPSIPCRLYNGVDIAIGANFLMNKKNRAILFNPGINFNHKSILRKINSAYWMNVNQQMVGLNLDVLIKISKTNYLRTGIFIHKMIATDLGFSNDESGPRNFYYSSENTVQNEGYAPKDIQAGMMLGLCMPFKLGKCNMKFDFMIQQSGTPVVSSNDLTNDITTGGKTKTFSVKDYPTSFLLGLEINLIRNKTPKEEVN